MKLLRQTVVAPVALVVALTATAGAAGYTMARTVDVAPGEDVTFVPSGWQCHNYGTRIKCVNGDERLLDAELALTRTGRATVKVHTFRDARGRNVTHTYTFTAS